MNWEDTVTPTLRGYCEDALRTLHTKHLAHCLVHYDAQDMLIDFSWELILGVD